MRSSRPIYRNRKRRKQSYKRNAKKSSRKGYRLTVVRIGIESAVEYNIGKKWEDKEILGLRECGDGRKDKNKIPCQRTGKATLY